jgi:PTH1 family peptidyl-tRNA hydrolase
MLILAGLGNPGAQYQHNRHNIGFMAVDALARRWSFPTMRSKFQGLAAEGAIDGVKVLLLKPQTFMNDSGRSIGEAVKFYKLTPADVVTFYDELDLAPGRFRMKTGGGAAGHNGVRSTIAHIGPDFRRARMGIGHPGHKDRVLGHVLSDFHKVDQAWLKALNEAVAEAAPMLADGEDERYQAEVMRLAPADKADTRAANRET